MSWLSVVASRWSGVARGLDGVARRLSGVARTRRLGRRLSVCGRGLVRFRFGRFLAYALAC